MRPDPDGGVTAVIVIANGTLRRSAWEALLARQPDVSVIATAPRAPSSLDTVPAEGPTAILVDGTGLGTAQAAELVTAAGGAGLLWLLDEIDLDAVVALLRAGVMGCLPVGARESELTRAIVAVGRGEIVLPPAVAAPALTALARPMHDQPGGPDDLTVREREVVDLLVQGLTNKDIAQTMFLSVRTVEAHLRSIFVKLDVRSRTEAVLRAIGQREESRDPVLGRSSTRPRSD